MQLILDKGDKTKVILECKTLIPLKGINVNSVSKGINFFKRFQKKRFNFINLSTEKTFVFCLELLLKHFLCFSAALK